MDRKRSQVLGVIILGLILLGIAVVQYVFRLA